MGTTIEGRYALGRQLGAGGMASVFAAHDRRLDRQVAVKVLPAAAVDPVARRRFIAEARTAARFRHHNAVAVYDAGEDGGLLYLVMELVDGPSLHAYLAARGPLPVGECLRIADGLLAALGDAHRAGVVHRDVKPGNVLLDGSARTPKLADFGIAKRLDDLGGDMTSTGQILGTPNYISPEQVAGEPATPQSDVYAVGVVLFEMLTGAAPFAGGTPLATARAYHAAPRPDVRAARADVPAAVVEAVDRALASSPAERFADADEMRAALSGLTVAVPSESPAVSPTVVMPPPPTQVMTAPPLGARRRRPWLPAAWLALVALVAFLVARHVAGGGSAIAVPTTTPDTPATATAPTTPTTVAATAADTAPPSTTPAMTAAPPTTAPATLDALIAEVASDPGAWGEHVKTLLDGLRGIAGAHGRKAADRAGSLKEQVGVWVADGQLDAAQGQLVDAVLRPLLHPGGA